MERWEGKIAVVTGASSGIGASIAEKLVEAGLQVVGLARRLERLQELEKKFKTLKGKFFPLKADISDKDNILSVFKHITEKIGPISILVNNAGISGNNTIVNGDIDNWKKVLDTNVYGLAVATREAIKSMQDNNIDGHIVNINSVAGHHIIKNVPNLHIYPASKFAVTAFTETLRDELVLLKSKIKTTSVSPGAVDTEIFEVSGLAASESVAKIIAMVPKLKSEDVANAVVYVLGTPPDVQIAELTIKPVGEFI